MKDIFELQNPSCNLRSSCSRFRRENIKTVHYGLPSVRYLDPKIWELVPNNIKYSNSLSEFKKLIKSWKPEACPCRLCQTYIAQVGFIYLYHYIKNISPVTYKFCILIVIIIISFDRLGLFRHTFNRCELLCNFNITWLTLKKVIQFNSMSSKSLSLDQYFN